MTTATAVDASSSPPPSISPHVVWKRLARLIAAPGRAQMRLYNPQTLKFSDTARITESLPSRSAAVYLYSKGRTLVLVLDFDVQRHSAAQVKADLDTAADWIASCGGVFITDSSTNGGRHLICPLAIGTSASREEMDSLARLLAARLPTLDITPNTNAAQGCISVPGSPDKHGGYRRVDGTLDDAVAAFTTRSRTDLLPRLQMLLGALKPTHSRPPDSTQLDTTERYLEGVGDDVCLAVPYRRAGPLPADVLDFATHGVLSPNRTSWASRHEARMSVVVNAIARGASLADLQSRTAPHGCWHKGLGEAYARYQHRAGQALARDHTKALHWYLTNVVKSSRPRHREHNYSQGGLAQGWRGPKDLRDWLANALTWADQEYAGKRCRWTVHAVLQALAFYAVVAGEQRSGTRLVGVGGRTLSIACGLLSEDTVWRVLSDVRDRPGSPLVLVRKAVSTDADVYALTTQNRVTKDAVKTQRVRVEAVHPTWSVLGHHLRRIYELVAQHGLTQKADIYSAAAVPRATGDSMVTDLEIAGLLTKSGRGTVMVGRVTLDDIAQQQHLNEVREERIERHRTERAAWRTWLYEREQQRNFSQVKTSETPVIAPASVGTDDAEEHAAWLRSTMATGPPDRDALDDEREMIGIIAEILGARIVTAQPAGTPR